MDDDLKKAVAFHGHLCPGLAIGYRIAKYVRERRPRAEDEELVCIAENNSCSVDAIQDMLGCTFGKGNLIYRDYGKQVFTFFSRSDSKALRIYFRGGAPAVRMGELRTRISGGGLTTEEKSALDEIRQALIHDILTAPADDILAVSDVALPEPQKARIYPSLTCQECGEAFMEICGRTISGEVVCKECFQRMVG